MTLFVPPVRIKAARAWGDVVALLSGIAQGLERADFGGPALPG
ncbi:hypothetical protein [Streptomyces sp. NPDC046805]